MLVMIGIIIGLSVLSGVVNPDKNQMVYDCKAEKMVFIPNHQDLMIELLLKSK